MSAPPFDLTDDTLLTLYNQCGKSVMATVERVKALYEASGGANILRMGTHNLPVDDPYPPSMVNADFVGGLAMPILRRIAKEQESDDEDSPIIGRKKPKQKSGDEDSPIIRRKKRESKRESKPQRQRKKPNRFAPSLSDSGFDDDYSDESPVKPKRRKHSRRRLRKGPGFIDDAAECDEDDEEEEEEVGSPDSMGSFIVPDHESTPGSSTPGSVATPGSVEVTNERSREERDAEGRANAINLISPDHA